MKLYNKKGLLLGLFWFLVGVSGLILELVKPGNNMAVHIRDIVLFALLLLFSIRQIVRAFSQTATREDMVEERDERNRFIKLKTGSTMFKVAEALLFLWTLGSMIGYGFTQDDMWVMGVIVAGFTLGLLFVIELFVGIYYDNKGCNK